MKVKVIKDACIGCGACENIAPNYFKINEENVSETIKTVVEPTDEEDVTDAMEACPTAAIEIENTNE